jgi:hypothetical protein
VKQYDIPDKHKLEEEYLLHKLWHMITSDILCTLGTFSMKCEIDKVEENLVGRWHLKR